MIPKLRSNELWNFGFFRCFFFLQVSLFYVSAVSEKFSGFVSVPFFLNTNGDGNQQYYEENNCKPKIATYLQLFKIM